MHTRPATPDDAAAIVAIYGHYVLHSYATFDLEPPPVGAWQARIAQARPEDGHHVLVAEADGAVVGYAYSGTWRDRAAYAGTVEVSAYVRDPGRGLGRALYSRLFDLVDAGPAHRSVAGIALPNDASVRLHERFGFRHVGTFSEVGRKFDRWWDVAWYERRPPAAGTAHRGAGEDRSR
ncbi:MAG TPA: GNAT family N-acetyltransferase [Mycobacteriales bacterium]